MFYMYSHFGDTTLETKKPIKPIKTPCAPEHFLYLACSVFCVCWPYHKQLKKNRSRFSRRRFLTVGSVGLAGVWAGFSDQLGARMVRGLVAETGRPVLKPKFTPTPGSWDANG